MTRSILIVVLIALIPTLSFAQSEEGGRVQVYSVTGIGKASGGGPAQFQIGGGVDALVFKGLSIGGELVRNKGTETAAGFNIFSTNGSFHFLGGGASEKFDPFATGGYSRLFASGAGAN